MIRQSTSLKLSSEAGDIEAPVVSDAAQEEDIIDFSDIEDDEEDDDDEDEIVDDGSLPGWYESKQRMQELRIKHRRHENDTGSPEFQVAGMTERIAYLTKHLKTHPKDFSTRRGLVALVNKRRRLLNYLYKEDVQRYSTLVTSLGVRHKAPGRVADRSDKYGRFPGQKAVKKHLQKKIQKKK